MSWKILINIYVNLHNLDIPQGKETQTEQTIIEK